MTRRRAAQAQAAGPAVLRMLDGDLRPTGMVADAVGWGVTLGGAPFGTLLPVYAAPDAPPRAWLHQAPLDRRETFAQAFRMYRLLPPHGLVGGAGRVVLSEVAYDGEWWSFRLQDGHRYRLVGSLTGDWAAARCLVRDAHPIATRVAVWSGLLALQEALRDVYRFGDVWSFALPDGSKYALVQRPDNALLRLV
jgi:hypothetical protein